LGFSFQVEIKEIILLNMEKIYFLSGLGSKIETTIEFNLELNKYGYEIKYIDIPGQYSNIDVNIKNEKEFLDWIKSVIPKNSLVMGYSLGADLLLKFSRFLYAKKKIILDGGIFEDDYMKTTLEEEKEYSRNYFLWFAILLLIDNIFITKGDFK